MAAEKSGSHKIITLAAPKSLPAAFLEDRRSVYWENGVPSKDFSRPAGFGCWVLTERQEQLARSKKFHPDHTTDRPSPIWCVSRLAKTVQPSQRILELSLPKMAPSNYCLPREVMTVISPAALQATPSPRLLDLARHKTHPPLLIKPHSEWDWEEWKSEINAATLNTTPSRHICSLADPKQTPERYVGPRVCWEVGKASQNYLASDRITKLARPKSKHEAKEDYDPHAYMVSRSALITRPSPRINQLALPIPRKVRVMK